MSRTRIKICGLTRPEDAALAVSLGADACGVVFAPSPRQVSIAQAALVFAEVPAPVACVGVFVDAAPAFVAEAVSAAGLTHVQLHGTEDAAACRKASAPAIKALRVGTDFDPVVIEHYRDHVAAVLLDAYSPHAAGGTGIAIPWHEVADLPRRVPVILAGGLTPDNVAEAIKIVRPFSVDVSSGVEKEPGVKDPVKMAAFFAAVASADATLPADVSRLPLSTRPDLEALDE